MLTSGYSIRSSALHIGRLWLLRLLWRWLRRLNHHRWALLRLHGYWCGRWHHVLRAARARLHEYWLWRKRCCGLWCSLQWLSAAALWSWLRTNPPTVHHWCSVDCWWRVAISAATSRLHIIVATRHPWRGALHDFTADTAR